MLNRLKRLDRPDVPNRPNFPDKPNRPDGLDEKKPILNLTFGVTPTQFPILILWKDFGKKKVICTALSRPKSNMLTDPLHDRLTD